MALGAIALVGCAESIQPPTQAAAEQLLAALDSAFNRGAIGDFAELFEGEIPRGSDRRLRRLLKPDHNLRQESVVTLFEAMGDIGFALASTTLWRVLQDQPARREDQQESQTYLAFRVRNGQPHVLVYEDVDPAAHKHLTRPFSGVYECPPCNFRIGTPSLQGWLVVPSPKRVAGCVEMVSFYRPGADIQLTLSVHRNPGHDAAKPLLQKLLQAWTDSVLPPLVDRGEIVAWRPPFYANDVPAGLEGARCDPAEGDYRNSTLYLVTRATPRTLAFDQEICYLLSVRGSAEARARYADDIDRWLASFELVKVQSASDAVGLASVRAHSGGSRVAPDGAFHNATANLRCAGPEGWTASLQADPGLFGVTYACPEGKSFVGVTAYERQPGDLEQRRAGARRLVEQRLESLDFEIVSESDWFEPPGSTPERSISACDIESRAKNGTTVRRNRILLFPDLWVLVAGHLEAEAAVAAYRGLCESVRR